MTIEPNTQPIPPANETEAHEQRPERRLITASLLRSFRACQRKHHYRYTLGVRPVREGDNLRFGTVMHAALEVYWIARRDGAESPASLANDALHARARDLDAYALARATAMLCAYTAHWDTVECEVLGVEVQFVSRMINPETGRASTAYDLGGKIDAIIRLSDGRIAVLEHKTSSEDLSLGGEYQQRLTLDGQVGQYFDGGDALHAQGQLPGTIDLVIYDVLGKPKIRPAKATPVEDRKYKKDGTLYAAQRETDETAEEFGLRCAEAIAADPAKYIVQYEVHRFATDRAEHQTDVWLLKDQLLAVEGLVRKGRTPPKNPDACFKYGSACEFLGVCQGRASLQDPTLFRQAEREHEELAAA